MNEEKELPTLHQLNDDCLYNIFKKLSIKEQLRLANTCERFRFIITLMIWRNQFQETRTIGADTNELNNQQYQDLFPHIVEYIEKFTIDFDADGGTRYARRPELDFYLFSHFPRLIHFECRTQQLDDDLMRLIVENCPKLQVLKVSSYDITGAHIKDMRNLRELYLPDCSLSSEHLSDILKHLNLTHLDVAGQLPTIPTLPIEHSFSKLRYLKLSENQFEVGFAEKCSYLRNLECLTVTHLSEKRDVQHVCSWQDLGANIVAMKTYNVRKGMHCMLAFAANTSKLTALNKIFIEGHMDFGLMNEFARLPELKEFRQDIYEQARPATILNFISRSKYLQRLDLLCYDHLFDMRLHWLLDIIEVLRKQIGRPTLCLNLNFVKTDPLCSEDRFGKIKRQVMEDVRYTSQSLLEITFNMQPKNYTSTYSIYEYIEMYFNKEIFNKMLHFTSKCIQQMSSNFGT